MDNRNLAIAAIAAIIVAAVIGIYISQQGGNSPTTTPLPTSTSATSATAGNGATGAQIPAKRSPPAAPDAVQTYTTTPSTLQYADIKAGTGESPVLGSVVTVEYTGWIRNKDGTIGKQFDSSYKGRNPFKFAIGRGNVIAGWDEGVMSMKIGGKRQLIIPADLGYGQRGAPPDIPGGSTLLFDVELLAIAPPRVVPEAPTAVAEADYTTTESGLKYHDITVGTGASPSMGDVVTVEYTGWLTNGKMFDSSYTADDAVQFKLGKVIAGWNEGLQTMKVGGKRQLLVPASLAYGERSIPPGSTPEDALIPPNSTLVFDVELVAVKGK